VLKSTGVATSFTRGINRPNALLFDAFGGLQHDCQALCDPRHPEFLMLASMKALVAEQI
jgi:hypothetical protein